MYSNLCGTVDSCNKYIRRETNVTSANITVNKNCNVLESHPVLQIISVSRNNWPYQLEIESRSHEI
jgi:hypothetical protein